MKNKKLWGGRFNEPTDAFVEKFTASISFDQRLWRFDIIASVAHATMLDKVGVLTADEKSKIITGLEQIAKQIENQTFKWSIALEDVHMNIEAGLTKLIGEAGKKLHTGRSRNDQIATDMRLYCRHEIDIICTQIKQLQEGILIIAKRETETIFPGLTHLQIAQPVTFGHHMLAWFEMLQRDIERMLDCRKRVNILPLGAAALAGTGFPIDRQYTAKLLEFEGVTENSLDSVSDRDFAIEFCATAAILMMHLSRFSEELILWVSPQFDFINLPDQFCTGSSIMPQKKNPDVPELVRGKSARVSGDLMSLLMLMKSQPLAYNKDNQEDKEPLFDSIDTLKDCLRAFSEMIPALTVNPEIMKQAAKKGYATATDLADYLVNKGISFRDAHEIVGKAVNYGIEQGQDLGDMALATLQTFSPEITQDVFDYLTLEGSINSRNHIGGTAPAQIREALKRADKRLTEKA